MFLNSKSKKSAFLIVIFFIFTACIPSYHKQMLEDIRLSEENIAAYKDNTLSDQQKAEKLKFYQEANTLKLAVKGLSQKKDPNFLEDKMTITKQIASLKSKTLHWRNKTEFLQESEKQLKALEEEIAQKLTTLSDKGKKDLQQALGELDKKQNEVKKQMNQIKSAAIDVWETLKVEANRAKEDFIKDWEKIKNLHT